MASASTIERTGQGPSGEVRGSDPRRWRALAVMLAAGFMDMLDTTVTNVAFPSLQKDLDATYAAVQWVLAGYTLTFAVALITGGRLGDIVGRKKMFLIGIGGFTLASTACGFAPTIELLIAARVVQGLAAAAMVPQLVSTIQVSFSAEERGKALGAYGAAAGLASVCGPIVGGALVQADLFGSQWRMIFLINIPIGIFGFVGALRWVRESRSENPPRLDTIGLVLATVAMFALVFPLVQGRELGWPAWSFGLLIGSAVLLTVFVLYERTRQRRDGSALLALQLFKRRAFPAGLIAWLLYCCAVTAFFLTFMLYLQIGRGFSALHAGLTGTPFAVGVGLAAGSAAKLANRYGARVLLIGAITTTIGFVGALVTVQQVSGASSWELAPSMLVAGIGFGVGVVPLADVVLAEIPERDAGSASGLFTTMQQLGAAIGVAVIGVVFFGALSSRSGGGAETAVPKLRTDLVAAGLPAAAVEPTIARFRQCARDAASEQDPSTTPASCRQPSAGALPPTARTAVTQALATAGTQARSHTFTKAFEDAQWWVVGGVALTVIPLTLLPRRAGRRSGADDAKAEPAGAAGGP